MVFAPTVNWLPNTVSEAVAVEPEPARFTLPKIFPPTANVTAPFGVEPELDTTVATRVVDDVTGRLAGLAVSVIEVPLVPLPPWLAPHEATILAASTEPSPVTGSYPGPAEYPY